MTAPNESLRRRVYNVTAMSFTPEELVQKLTKFVPELRVTYKPDTRQNIGMFLFLFIYDFICQQARVGFSLGVGRGEREFSLS